MDVNKVIRALVVMSGISFLHQGASAGMRATEEFESGETRPVVVALLPAHAELLKQQIVSTQSQVEESAMLAEHLAAAVAREFQERGYELRVLTPQQINSDPELQSLVVDADRRYQEILSQLQRRLRKEIEERQYNAGDEMRLLAQKLGVDAIAFTRIEIAAAGKGRQAMAWTVGIGSTGSSTMMSVSLIDGRTADIEAYFVPPILRRGRAFAGYNEFIENPAESMEKITAATLKELPDADPELRAQFETEEEDLFSELDALLE